MNIPIGKGGQIEQLKVAPHSHDISVPTYDGEQRTGLLDFASLLAALPDPARTGGEPTQFQKITVPDGAGTSTDADVTDSSAMSTDREAVDIDLPLSLAKKTPSDLNAVSNRGPSRVAQHLTPDAFHLPGRSINPDAGTAAEPVQPQRGSDTSPLNEQQTAALSAASDLPSQSRNKAPSIQHQAEAPLTGEIHHARTNDKLTGEPLELVAVPLTEERNHHARNEGRTLSTGRELLGGPASSENARAKLPQGMAATDATLHEIGILPLRGNPASLPQLPSQASALLPDKSAPVTTGKPATQSGFSAPSASDTHNLKSIGNIASPVEPAAVSTAMGNKPESSLFPETSVRLNQGPNPRHSETRVAAPVMSQIAAPPTPKTARVQAPISDPSSSAQLMLESGAKSDAATSLLVAAETPEIVDWNSNRINSAQQGPLPVQRTEMVSQIARQLTEVMPSAASRPVEIALSPEELGRVRMGITTDEGKITISILAERPETLDLMRRHIDQLGQSFRSLGYEQVSFLFGQGTGNGDQADVDPKDQNASARTVPAHPDEDQSPVIINVAPTTASGVDIRL